MRFQSVFATLEENQCYQTSIESLKVNNSTKYQMFKEFLLENEFYMLLEWSENKSQTFQAEFVIYDNKTFDIPLVLERKEHYSLGEVAQICESTGFSYEQFEEVYLATR